MLKIATVSGEVYFWLLVWKKFKHTDYIIKTFYFLIAVYFYITLILIYDVTLLSWQTDVVSKGNIIGRVNSKEKSVKQIILHETKKKWLLSRVNKLSERQQKTRKLLYKLFVL